MGHRSAPRSRPLPALIADTIAFWIAVVSAPTLIDGFNAKSLRSDR
jgi:hypothetical protein